MLKRDKALAWLRTAPRTTAQLAELIGISVESSVTLCWRLRRQGLIVPVGPMARGRGQQARYKAAA